MTKYLRDTLRFLFLMTLAGVLSYNGQIVASFLIGIMYQLNLIFEKLGEIKKEKSELSVKEFINK